MNQQAIVAAPWDTSPLCTGKDGYQTLPYYETTYWRAPELEFIAACKEGNKRLAYELALEYSTGWNRGWLPPLLAARTHYGQERPLILELGSGSGICTALLAQYGQVVSIEPVAARQATACHNWAALGLPIVSLGTTLDGTSDDWIVSIAVFQHLLLGDKFAMLDLIVTKLAPGGMAYLYEELIVDDTMEACEALYRDPKTCAHMIPVPFDIVAARVAPLSFGRIAPNAYVMQ